MKLADKILEVTNNNDDVLYNAGVFLDEQVHTAFVDSDEVTQYLEIHKALNEGREIEMVEYEPTGVPEKMVADLQFAKQMQNVIEAITNNILFNMEVEDFEKWVINVDHLIFKAKQLSN